MLTPVVVHCPSPSRGSDSPNRPNFHSLTAAEMSASNGKDVEFVDVPTDVETFNVTLVGNEKENHFNSLQDKEKPHQEQLSV